MTGALLGGIFLSVMGICGKDGQESSLQEVQIEILRLEDFGIASEASSLPEEKQEYEETAEVPELPKSVPATPQDVADASEGQLPSREMEMLEWELVEDIQEEALPVFIPRAKQTEINLQDYKDYTKLVKTFFTIDGGTMAGSDQLNVADLTAFDCSISKTDEPQILILHTHSKETYADSVPGDESTSIVGAGNHLGEILAKEYGYQVMHCKQSFDEGEGVDAYSNALPVLNQILAAYPSLEVVIDLHRDEMPAGKRLVTDIDGIPMAKFMFFNGISRTRKTGDIAYLKNENLEENLSFSFQLQTKAMEYYPGLTRRIYLKAYRYNMHLKERYLLIELGAQNNTVQEAFSACGPIAHILDLVLSGQ